jgi:3-mercaptopyruvate sulfurtransferase SseA
MSKIKIILAIFTLSLAALACKALSSQTNPTSVPTEARPTSTVLPAPEEPQGNIPQKQDEVPRVLPDAAKTAFDAGQAIIVDVRSADVYAVEHIAGAISIPLDQIESDPSRLNLDKNQWIITYCT